MTETPIPIVLVGKTPPIAKVVIELLKPEYEVIYTLLALPPSQTALEITSILTSTPLPLPSPTSEQLGTKNYTRPPVAILLGGKYEDELFEEIYRNSKEDGKKDGDNRRRTPFLRCDLSKEAPPIGPGYAEVMVQRIKGVLGELVEKGGLGENDEDVVWY